MKKGTGDDPFATAEEDETESESDGEDTENDGDGIVEDPFDAESDQTDDRERVDDTHDTVDSTHEIITPPPQSGRDDSGVPWVYTRSNVKQDREMVQFYLREYLQQAEDRLVDEVSEELGSEVTLTDVREAAYEAAMLNPELIVDRLEAWGFEGQE